MMVAAKFDSVKSVRPHEYAQRFLFGGLCTAMAGLIAKRFGPGIGGLFLAFPAIFPAGASLIEKHERMQKQKIGVDGTNRGRAAASLDAAGAALGCLGLMSFALVLWAGLPRYPFGLVLTGATLTWLVVSVSFWLLRKRRVWRRLTSSRSRGQL
jgi:hypothetical protein